jgi:dTDP-4-dehydrorhamnose 3,5-epimerase
VLVDVRGGSPTFGQWEGFELTEENMHVLYCPMGFAHGFCVLSDVADVMYKQSNYYADETERGIAYDDPEVGDPVAAADRAADPLPARRLRPATERDRRRPALPLPRMS